MLTGAYGMAFTLGQAAKRVGVSKPTLSKHIKNGRLSAKKLETGAFAIDDAELGRFISSYTKPEPTEAGSDDQNKREEPGAGSEIELLRSRVAQLEIELAEARTEARAAHEAEREAWRTATQIRLLESNVRKGWLDRLIGK